MPNQLLDSQLEELEEPIDAITVSILGTPIEITDQIVEKLS
jgi:gluconate kinase